MRIEVSRIKHLLLMLLAVGLLSSCSWSDTSVAPVPIPTALPSPTPLTGPTEVLPTIVLPVQPTATPMAVGNCFFDSTFVGDVTIPDNTVLAPGQPFTKTWRLRNTGSCDWGPGYQLVFTSGILMGSSSSTVPAPTTPVGAMSDISVEMIASYQPGVYTSIWRLQAPDGSLFGMNVYAQIIVQDEAGTPFPTPTLVSYSPRLTATPTPVTSIQPTVPPTVPPSSTPMTHPTEIPPVGPGVDCVDNSAFVADVTIPDDTLLIPGIPFLKTWRLRNTGSCAWGTGYSLAFTGGNRMQAAQSVSVPPTPANATVDITVQMFTPTLPGTYAGVWQMVNPSGKFFGTSVYVQIVVGQTTSPEPPPSYPTVPYLTGVGERARAIYLRGQQLGNYKNVMAKVGDSITYAHEYLWPIGEGRYDLNDYSHLQTVVDEFGPSFTRESLAAQGGFTLWDLLAPECGDPTHIECEYKTVRPSVALIMIGTNDLNATNDLDGIEGRLRQVIDITIDHGVVPVLSTIPASNWYDVTAYNGRVAKLASEYSIPLLDYYTTMQGLPNKGLSGDGTHPSVPPDGNSGYFDNEHLAYGYTMRNLTTLQMLDVLWHSVMY